MKYGQISMNSDRGALWIIINFCPPPALLPHSSAPAGTPVASHGPPAGVAAPPLQPCSPPVSSPCGLSIPAPSTKGSGQRRWLWHARVAFGRGREDGSF